MSPDNAFLRALLAQPDDDTLRLVMADWLDESDQPERAEFIRVQIELARGVVDRDRRRELEFRQRDLLTAHQAAWVKPLADVLGCKPGEWGGWVFRRGFVEYFRISMWDLVRCGRQLAKLTPLRELNVGEDRIRGFVVVCRQPWLRSVTHLYNVRLEDNTARALLSCPYLTGLRVLQVGEDSLPRVLRKQFRRRFAAVLVDGG